MKDVISILQSRIAKRENKIRYYTQKMKIVASVFDSEFKEYEFQLAEDNSPLVIGLVMEQKQDKRILAEIVQLRRELKSEKEGRKAVLELGCDRIEAHAKALEKSRKEVEELRAQIKKLDAILDRFYRAEEI